MKIGYLGPEGTFSYSVAKLFSTSIDKKVDLNPYSSIESVFFALTSKEVDKICVPIENSIEGSVTISMDLLVSLSGFFVEKEIVLPVEHSLMVNRGQKKENIATIISHPQPLSQARNYIKRKFPNISLQARLSTSAAAQDVVGNNSWAVIGHESLIDLYDLDLLDKGIQDAASNKTRFLILSSASNVPSKKDKTSIIFSARKDIPGSLVTILNIFSEHGINLLRIESRPTKIELGEYLFFVDCDGHRDIDPLKSVLQRVESFGGFYKCLGSYPKATTDD